MGVVAVISSGQREQVFYRERTCPSCGHHDEAELYYDPELSLTELTWECPRCKTEHVEDAG